MSSSMAMWDYVPVVSITTGARKRCERCGQPIWAGKDYSYRRYCSEICRKRAERARWKRRWKKRGINKYIGAREKEARRNGK